MVSPEEVHGMNAADLVLTMSDTPVAICSHALMDIEARPRQCANPAAIDTQVGFQMIFAIVLRC